MKTDDRRPNPHLQLAASHRRRHRRRLHFRSHTGATSRPGRTPGRNHPQSTSTTSKAFATKAKNKKNNKKSMEKEHQPDSMATVQMKPDYPPSEVYSTSEPPPAYRHPRPASVQIARLAAATIIISSLLLGSFILAASYIHARAGCHQLDQLDAMLEKELALEARQMEADYAREESLPLHAQALHQAAPPQQQQPEEKRQKKVELNEEKLQSVDNNDDSADSEGSDSEDSSDEEGDVKDPIRITLPLQLDFDELAGALFEKNQRSRMNCVVEKRKAENLVDHQPRSLPFGPFGLNLTTDPRLERVTGERMAIFCESGNENRHPEAEILPQFPFPLPGPVSLPLSFPVNRFGGMRPPMPAQHMQAPGPQPAHPYNAMPPQQHEFMARARPPFPPQFLAQREMPPQPQQQQEAQAQMLPHPIMMMLNPFLQQQQQQQAAQESQQQQARGYQPPQMTLVPREVRIHVQRIRLPQVERDDMPRDSHQEDRQQQQPEIQLQQLPIQMISEDELRAVQQVVRAAVQEDVEQMRAAEEQEAQEAREVHEASREMIGRQAMARALPVDIPVPMMEQDDSQRPHYVQPRSVRSARSVDAMLHREKRVKRSCSCDCAC